MPALIVNKVGEMKLETAIEIFDSLLKYPLDGQQPSHNNAFRIASEAIKRCQEFRKYQTPGVYMPLPGETEE